MKVSVIIPAYNEARTIEAVILRVQAVDLGPFEKEIVVVDDGSSDGTADVLKGLGGIQYIVHGLNAGKGAAIGALAGALLGSVHRKARQQEREAWREEQRWRAQHQQQWTAQVREQGTDDYRRAFAACMSARNYTVR